MVNNVCAVIVTYNRLEMLKEGINSLLNQSHSLNKIFVINNNSSDGTKEYLTNLAKEKDTVEPVHLEENLGGAGGFHIGSKLAYEKGYDWIWLMDDDAEPEVNCLKRLLSEVENSEENIAYIAPVIVHKETNNFQNYHHKLINNTLTGETPISVDRINSEKKIKIDANAFVGPLISRKAIDENGLPRKDFFIWLDDTEFTYRISRKYSGYLLTNAVIFHKDFITNSEQVKSFWKVCYGIRNRMLWINSNISGINLIFSYAGILSEYLKWIVKFIIQPKWAGNRKYLMKHLNRAISKGLKNEGGIFITPSDFINNIK